MLKRDDIILGAFSKLGIPYLAENYITTTIFRIANEQFDSLYKGALHSIGTEYNNKLGKLQKSSNTQTTTYNDKVYTPYYIPNDLLGLDEKPNFDYIISDGYFLIANASDTVDYIIRYFRYIDVKNISEKYRQYIEYYLAGELANVVSKSSRKKEMTVRALQEIEKIQREEKTGNMETWDLLTSDLTSELY